MLGRGPEREGVVPWSFILSIAESELVPEPGTDVAARFDQADAAFTLVPTPPPSP